MLYRFIVIGGESRTIHMDERVPIVLVANSEVIPFWSTSG